MYIRFVVPRRHPDTGVQAGIFAAIKLLPPVGQLPYWDELRLQELRAWFNTHLPAPTRVARSRRPNGHHAAVSWFKTSARLHVAQARELAALLVANDVLVEELWTRRPGYVVYEDAVQLLAEPFRAEHPLC